MHEIKLDGHVFHLRAAFDFSFLATYGRVFRVFDQQDSGNLCFGVDGPAGSRFLKLAGAQTERGGHVAPEEAVARLKATLPVYEALRHPALLNILEHGPVPGGYLAVFEWFDGTCMGKQYGDYERCMALPVAEMLPIYRVILDFHLHVQALGYLALDFYDGCMLYDFETRRTRLCDIEFYRKLPSVNEMGRMWGSARYMSPEDFTLGAALDERTNVFTLGATAFHLFGGAMDRCREKWRLGDAAFAVAARAVAQAPDCRYPDLKAYAAAWQEALQLS